MPDIFISPKNHPPAGGPKPNPDKNHAYIFSSFCEYPVNVSFEHQRPDEKILLFLRRHFVTNLSWILTIIFFIFLPLIVPFILSFLDLNSIVASKSLMAIILLFYYLILFSLVLVNFMTWFYNIFIVTAERVIDIDYSHTVIHNVAETKLSHIQDVNYTQTGFIHSLFNYGDVFVQTAGNEANFEALSVPKPRGAAKIIASLIGKKI